MAKYTFLLILSVLFFNARFADGQEVKNIHVLQGEKNQVIVGYSLTGDNNQKFDVSLFYTTDNGNTWKGPLKNVIGDVGKEITRGNNKHIKWNITSENTITSGYMQFKVEAEPIFIKEEIKPFEQEKITQVNKTLTRRERTKYRGRKTWSFLFTIISAGVGVYTYTESNSLYDEYQNSYSSDDANSQHSKVEKYDKIYPVAFLVAGLSAVSFIVYSSKRSKVKKELKLRPLSMQGDMGVTLCFRF